MAVFQNESSPVFHLTNASVAETYCFAIRRKDITARWDAKYFALREEIAPTRFPLRPLSSLVSEEPNYGSGARAVARTNPSEPRYIRITDFGEDGIEPGHEFVTADPVEMDCILAADDLLFARSGATVGKTYLHEDTTEPAIFAGYCIRFRFNRTLVLPRFVYWATKTGFYARWIAAIQRPAGQPNINKEEFKSFKIPLPVETGIQSEMVGEMDDARQVRRAKTAEADALLTGLNDFVLEALGLKASEEDHRTVFAVRRANVVEERRLNADYFHPERIHALRNIEAGSNQFERHRLSDVVNFVRDQVKTPGSPYLSLAHVQSNTGELVEADEAATGVTSVFRSGDVLFARLRPYLNKVYRAEMSGSCSPEFHVMRVRNQEELRPDYLAAILRSELILAQTRHMMTGNTHPRLTNDDVVNLVIPVPTASVQDLIVAESRRRREVSRALRVAAEADWRAAKQRFENRLLEPRGA